VVCWAWAPALKMQIATADKAALESIRAVDMIGPSVTAGLLCCYQRPRREAKRRAAIGEILIDPIGAILNHAVVCVTEGPRRLVTSRIGWNSSKL
jgi:hypothetical protein